jgi:predicted DNA-binding protein
MAMADPTTGHSAVVIRMPLDLHEAIKRKAAREERSMAQAIRHAIRLYAEDGEPVTPVRQKRHR